VHRSRAPDAAVQEDKCREYVTDCGQNKMNFHILLLL
jgi:hypothetical protein